MLENILIVLYTEDSSPLDPPFITTCINVVIHVYRTKVVQLSKHGIIQFSSVTQSCLTPCNPWTTAHQTSLSTVSWSLFKLMSIESVMPSNQLILGHPRLLLPSIFSNELALCIRWPKYWSFSLSPSNEYSGLISYSIDWFDLLAVQVTLKSLLQHHNLKASILQCSDFFIRKSHF